MPYGNRAKNMVRPLVSRIRNRGNTALYGSCVVLLYHRVIALETDPQQLAVDPDHFERHLEVLKEDHCVLKISEFDDHLLNAKKFPKRSVLITFDDGYGDNQRNACPILEKHGMQALFYITTDHIGAMREYWWDELERILLVNEDLPAQFNFRQGRFELEWNTTETIEEVYLNSLGTLRAMSSNMRDAILNELQEQLGSVHPRPTHLPMTRAALQGIAASPAVVIGAHTVGHPSLAALNENDQYNEIEGSKLALEEILGREIPYFSYPFGTGADFNATTEKLVQDIGFMHVAANYPGITHARSPRFKFPRFLVRNWSGPEFRAQLEGFFKT